MKKTCLIVCGLGAMLGTLACSSGDASANGANGTNGSSCTVAQTSTGATITCSDGTSATLNNGTNTSACSVTQTSGGAKIICPDGSSATVTNGANGTNGTNGSGYEPATSGSRLTVKQQTWTGADGAVYAPLSYTFHDNTLNVDCQPMTASDGIMRCLPTITSGAGYYTDAACTLPAALRFTNGVSCATPTYVNIGGSYNYCLNGANSGPAVYSVSGTSSTLYTISGTCTSVASLFSSGYTAYSLGSVVPPSTFASFTGP